MKTALLCSIALLLAATTAFPQPPDTLWTRTFGGDSSDIGSSVQQTTDGGYIIAGNTNSYGQGQGDYWLVKTDSIGNLEWSQTYGGSSYEDCQAAQETSDGGYVVVGATRSFSAGGTDFYVVKTDSIGEPIWSRSYGGQHAEWAKHIIETSDGGFAIVGHISSTGSYCYGYLIRTDQNGNQLWSRQYGGTETDGLYSIQETDDGGFIMGGVTQSFGAGWKDMYLIRTDANGDTLWTRTFGGTGNDWGFRTIQTFDGGFILVGEEQSFGASDMDMYVVKTDSAGNTLWSQSYGGTGTERAYSVNETFDHGLIIAGYTDSFGAGSHDVWVVKTDANGNEQWSRTVGGSDYDNGCSAQQTTDGGYIIAGYTESYGAGNKDFWLIRLDGFSDPYLSGYPANLIYEAEEGGNNPANQTFHIANLGTGTFNYTISESMSWLSVSPMSGGPVPPTVAETVSVDISGLVWGSYEGDIIVSAPGVQGSPDTVHAALNLLTTPPDTLWTRTFGSSDWEEGKCVQQTNDDGYIITGSIPSVSTLDPDICLIKTNSAGSEQWSRTFGHELVEEGGNSVQQTTDGGYVIAGYTGYFPDYDFWLIKTDSQGIEQWNHTFGGSSRDLAYSVQQTNDGGYVVVGYTASYGAGYYDVWLVKTDSLGVEQWNRSFGGIATDKGYCVQQAADGGYIIAGHTESFGAGTEDVWLVKTDALGNQMWNRTFGGTSEDMGRCVVQTTDGGYVITGYTESSGAERSDVWLIKTDASGIQEWNRIIGGSDLDEGYCVQQTSDGGYIITGHTFSYGAGSADVWVIKTDANGIQKWKRAIGGSNTDKGYCIQETSDGGCIIVGDTWSYGAGGYDIWLVRIASETPVEIEPNLNIPNQFILYQPYPNPFNPSTKINYIVPVKSKITLNVYNILGQKVVTLFNGIQQPGHHTITWNATDVPSGIYFCRMSARSPMGQANSFTQIQKLVLLR